MQTNAIISTTRQLGKSIARNSPTILTSLGVVGLIGTVVLAVKATPRAMMILAQEKMYRDEEVHDPNYELPIEVNDAISLTWKCYIPTTAMGLITIGCIVGANHISLRRNAALVSLFSLTEQALKEYQAKVVEQVGPAKEEKIRGEIAQEKLNKKPMDEKTVILTGKGSFLCFDSFSARYFRSDAEELRKAENIFNQKLLREGWLGINEFYDIIELDPIELGDEMGWIAERNLMELKYTTKLASDDEPCLVIEYYVSPHHI